MKGMIGKKVGMTQVFTEDRVIPVTVVKASPCVITQVKTVDTDGYHAIQMGMIERAKEKNMTNPVKGHLKKSGSPSIRRLMELRLKDPTEHKVGDQLSVNMFASDEIVDVVGHGKGKGFQGVIRRHGFKGGKASHGSMFHRAPGSIGQSAWPSRVWKGMKMGGRTGGKKITVKNLKIVKVDPENNLLFIRGAVPGTANSYLFIRSSGRGM